MGLNSDPVIRFILLILCLIVVSSGLIINYNNIKNSKKKTQEFIREYNEKFQNQDISYVVVEINPKAVLEYSKYIEE